MVIESETWVIIDPETSEAKYEADCSHCLREPETVAARTATLRELVVQT